VLANCIKRLLPKPRVGAHNLPSTATVTVRQRGEDLIVHILDYVHQRRGSQLDVIEDILPLYDVQMSVRASQRPTDVRTVPELEAVGWDWEDGYVCLSVPCVNGYQIVELVGAGAAGSDAHGSDVR
jgi:hypothetical protein